MILFFYFMCVIFLGTKVSLLLLAVISVTVCFETPSFLIVIDGYLSNGLFC